MGASLLQKHTSRRRLQAWRAPRDSLESLAWFECQLVGEHPAGDHVLALGKVIDGKLLDSKAEPMGYRETGAMDGAAALFPEVFAD